MVDDILFIHRFDALVVAELGQHNAQDHRLIAIGDEDRATAITLEGGEVHEEKFVGADRRQRMAGDGAVAADGETGGVGLEAGRVAEDGHGAANMQVEFLQQLFIGEAGER